jgi:fatty-acyl-CoA synthase
MKSPLKAWIRALERTAPIEHHPTVTLPVLIDTLADRFESAPALLDRNGALSYRALAETANRYAHWALSAGLRSGDVVGLLLPNCPDYMAIWLGLSRVGVTVSLLNTQLSGTLLAHSINIVAPRDIIVGATLTDALASARPLLPTGVQCWAHGHGAHGLPRLDRLIAQLPPEPPTEGSYRAASLADRALYIYTSGTTGLPKAANVSHFRIMQWSHWFAGMMDTAPSDRMYDCLPLYHSVGGVVATGATLLGGGAVVLRERFSAREFWPDVIAERCTLFQYIGELCRYLVASPRCPEEMQHQLRLCCGNGLRADVWAALQSRFRIPEILEYYAATEGNFSLYNCEGRIGAIGRIPPFLIHRMPIELVRFDQDEAAPARDQRGHCVRCGVNEVGEAIGKIVEQDGAHASRFEGYADAAATERKILRNVFEAGDSWYRTGDLMRRDAQGYFYFVDRVGDTFRWKGENVSTTEVTMVISSCPGITDATVYGVAIPGRDGRAGMAALATDAAFDLVSLRRHLVGALPEYARPLFLRIVDAIEVTATFKLKRQQLMHAGYDPATIRDTLYYDDRAAGCYVRLDAGLYQRIVDGDLRL